MNEPIGPGNRSDGLRSSVFLKAFGPEYISRALIQARVFAPQAQLIIDEYGLEYDLPKEVQRRTYFLKLLARLKEKDVPLDGIGLQAHLDLRKGQISQIAAAAVVLARCGGFLWTTKGKYSGKDGTLMKLIVHEGSRNLHRQGLEPRTK